MAKTEEEGCDLNFSRISPTERKKRSGRMEVYRSMRVYQYLCGINGMLITFRLQGPFHILFVQSIAVILQLKCIILFLYGLIIR